MLVLNQTGAAILNQILTLSGQMAPSGGGCSFTAVVPTGVSTLAVTFPRTYAYRPLLSWGLKVESNVTYLVSARNVTTSGYTAAFSDTVLESGVTLITTAQPPSA